MNAATLQATVREATFDDLPSVVAAIIAMREDTVWRHLPFTPNAEYIGQRILADLQQPQHHCWVAEEEGQIVGVCGVELVHQRFIPDFLFVQEWALWVLPSRRGEGLAYQLWEAAKDWGHAAGAHGDIHGQPMAHGEYLKVNWWGEPHA